MKDIGAQFKEQREHIGLSIEEVSKDLSITSAQLQNLEDGNINAFKDVFFLKDAVAKYSKYLNLNEEDIMNKYNEYVFDFTSKIPIKELEERVKEINKEEKENRQIHSPYTLRQKSKKKINMTIVAILLVGVMMVVTVALMVLILTSRQNSDVGYVKEGVMYEFTK